MRLPHFHQAFPTLFKPIETPTGPSDDEDIAVLRCFQQFLTESLSGGLFLNGSREPSLNPRVFERMHSSSKLFCALHAEGFVGTGTGDLSPRQIHDSMREGLHKPDSYWGMFVIAQNAVLLVHRVLEDGKDNVVRVYAWEVQASNTDVMSKSSSVMQSCPRTAVRVPWNRFKQFAIAECLSELTRITHDKAVTKSRKGGEEFDETREVTKPMYITEYFLSLLGGELIPENKIVAIVTKKMNDNVIYSGGALPWRRSPFWSALKSLLHVVCMTESLSTKPASKPQSNDIVYKIVIQNFLAFCYDKIETEEVATSWIHEGARKITRRLAKIQTLGSSIEFSESSLNYCKKVVEKKMKMVQEPWVRKSQRPLSCALNLKKINVKDDVRHQLKNSDQILSKLAEVNEGFYQLNDEKSIPEPTGRVQLAHLPFTPVLLNCHRSELEVTFKKRIVEPQDVIGQLHDVAVTVAQFFRDVRDRTVRACPYLDSVMKANGLVAPIIDFLDCYGKVGHQMHPSDPRGCGEVILVSLSLVIILDMLSCNHFTILKDHKLGIDPSFLQYVYVSSVPNKALLHELEEYIKKRNDDASFPSSIEAERSASSLSVRYATADSTMITTWNEIQNQCKSNQDAKELERKKKMREYNNLQNQINREGSCSCHWIYTSNGYQDRWIKCRRCELKRQAAAITVPFYERLLPPCKINQLAVVFELKQPTLLTGQRNAILILSEQLCVKKWCGETERYLWESETRLTGWIEPGSVPTERKISLLGSRRKKLSSSHYGRSSKHVTDHSTFVVANDYETVLMGNTGMAVEDFNWHIKPNLVSIMLPPTSPFKNLEEFFNSFSHCENKIIAYKSMASENISLNEFEKVGTLRAGPSLQLIRLCSCFQQRDIALDREEIVLLISSVIWQAGPPCSADSILLKLGPQNQDIDCDLNWCRKSTESLKDPAFVKDICNCLHAAIDGCSSSWAKQNILINVIHVAMFVFEHALKMGSCPTIAAGVVKKCRKISARWIPELEEAVNESNKDSVKQELKVRIVDVACAGSLTFNNSYYLLDTPEEVGLWLYFRAKFNDNFSPTELKVPSYRRSRLLHAYHTAEIVSPRLHKLLLDKKEGLDKFLHLYWSAASKCNFTRDWNQYDAQNWFHLDYDDINGACKLQLNILDGTFLVDGLPSANLPRSISSHEVFTRLFGKSTFMVQRCGKSGFRTTLKVNGCFYEFYPSPNETLFKNSPIIIQEYPVHDDDGDYDYDYNSNDNGNSNCNGNNSDNEAGSNNDSSRYHESVSFNPDHTRGVSQKDSAVLRSILVPWYIFEGDFPEQLQNYSHWFVLSTPENDNKIKKNWVYLRPISYNAENDVLTRSILEFFLSTSAYTLNYCERLVFETKTKQKLIDVRSETFEELFNVFQRLAPKLRIHVSVTSSSINLSDVPLATITIPLLQNMKFSLDCNNGLIRSADFNGLKVASNQNFGSLIGMKHGLLLDGNSSSENKIVVYPHGKVLRTEESIGIEINNLRSPAFFRYEIKPELKDIRSCTRDKMSALFLAMLHAATSDVLPDPFLCSNGTQKSLSILRSGHCSGNILNTLNDNEIEELFIAEARMLCEIASISPTRKEYHDMEMNNLVISRDSGAICAHPAYAFMVQQRLDDLDNALKLIGKNSKTIAYLNDDQHKLLAERTSDLSRRAYHQSKKLYPKDSLLLKEEETELFTSDSDPNRVSFLNMLPLFDEVTITNMQKVGYEIQNQQFHRMNVTSLSDFLCKNENLVGVTERTILTGAPYQCFNALSDDDKQEMPFRDVWLNLYNICHTKVNRDPNKITSISFLLGWVLTKYPQMSGYIQQLSIIALYPDKFPSMIQYGISENTSYEKPYEQYYLVQYVTKSIKSYLRCFQESAPSRDHVRQSWLEENYKNWASRRDAYNTRREKEMKQLESHIKTQWNIENGKSIDSLPSLSSLLDNQHVFLQNINKLFQRWEKAKKLHNFLDAVTIQLKQIDLQDCSSIPPFKYITPTTSTNGSEKCNFCLRSCPELDQMSNGDNDAKMELSKIKPFSLCRQSQTITVGNRLRQRKQSKKQRDQVLRLMNGRFVEKHNEYQEVWNALVDPLIESYKLVDNYDDTCLLNQDDLELDIHLEEYEKRATCAYQLFYERITHLLQMRRERDQVVELQRTVGLWDATSPYAILLRYIQDKTINGSSFYNELISFAIATKHVMRARRCRRLLREEGSNKHLLSDLSNQFPELGSNVSWIASNYPEFILFELDNDIGIRDTQIKVAKEMLKHTDDCSSGRENYLLQLNMGEGKTAVIMPIVLARAASERKKLARATVLNSLYKTNSENLQYQLGGLLNRRVYPMLCRRDLTIGVPEANILLKTCQQIMSENHIIVTVPEHRLSLENKAIELASDLNMNKNVLASKALLCVLNLLSSKSMCDFLDESDEILGPKYQLIYTLGTPCDTEGSSIRWEVHQCIYECIARNATMLFDKYGPNTIEIVRKNSKRASEYVGLRLLEDSQQCDEVCAEIKQNIVHDILSGRSSLTLKLKDSNERHRWTRCVSGKEGTDVIKDLPNNAKIVALCLRGMLEHGVLKIVLSKRWRVQYGNHPTRIKFYMAVPYRAKDIAADRTEFGHPDVALSLTFNHYFMAGLDKTQLRDVFERLQRMSDSDANVEYDSWIAELPNKLEVQGISSFEGINIEDTSLFDSRLFPIFRRHMRVVKFYLFKLVLPIQAKQFPKKLLSTSSELCRSSQLCENWKAVTRGFSGTDDQKLLLPPTIVQQNIPELEMTNGLQIKNLLRQENNYYIPLVDDNTANEILEKVLLSTQSTISNQQDGTINVVLDAGALILQMSDRLFAKSWLDRRGDMEAVAFFESNAIVVVTRDGMLLKYDDSPYSKNMTKCLLYLDEIHTRGSDFRLPLKTRAVLTLGKDMQKDKFMQACMRMRSLGNGQSITFAASREVNMILESDFDLRLPSRSNNTLGSIAAILEWTISNSVKKICELIPYSVNQARSTFRKADAYNRFYFQNKGTFSLERFAHACIEDEVLSLDAMYGHQRGEDTLPNIVGRQLDAVSSLLWTTDGQQNAQVLEARIRIAKLARTMKHQMERLAPSVVVGCNMLDEEQERELEHELEEEIQIERPPPAVALKSDFSEGLFQVLRHGLSNPNKFKSLCEKYLDPLKNIFRGTTFSDSQIAPVESCGVYTTTDFINTVKGENGKDFYIKNIRWFLKWDVERLLPSLSSSTCTSNKVDPYPIVVVISNYEAEQISSLLASGIQQQRQFPNLYAFAPITRVQQRPQLLTMASCAPPVLIHVYGGSINADRALWIELRDFLSMFRDADSIFSTKPPPQITAATSTEIVASDGIDRDGFVLPTFRSNVVRHYSHSNRTLLYNGSASPFQESPVQDLLDFYRNSRHLGSELPASSVGKLLGAS